LDAPETQDVDRALVVGLAGAIPVIGTFASALLDQFMPEQRARRTVEFLTALGGDVDTIRERIDVEFVRTDEFQGLFEEALERVGERRAQGKRAYYAAAVANSALPERADEEARFRMLDILNELRPAHLRLLSRLSAGGSSVMAGADALTVGQAAVSAIASAASGATDDVWLTLAELERLGLTSPVRDSAILVASNVRAVVTPLGMAFLAFVSNPGEAGTGSR
jgi:hypothetical protein